MKQAPQYYVKVLAQTISPWSGIYSTFCDGFGFNRRRDAEAETRQYNKRADGKHIIGAWTAQCKDNNTVPQSIQDKCPGTII